MTPQTPSEWTQTRAIFVDYANAIEVDLRFQDFESELADLPGQYAPPRGALLLALVETAADAGDTPVETAPGFAVAGCCALRPLDNVDYANAAEMKRLYVRPAYRNLGLGRLLAEAILDAARNADYACVLLDTLDEMESARSLYGELGFVEVPPYYHNPIAGAHYLKAAL